MPRSSQRRIRNQYIRETALDPDVYPPIREVQAFAKELILSSFGCPIGHKQCGELSEINEQYSEKNIFVAIPYSNYRYENAIRETITRGALTPIIAKDKIQSHVILCKVCKGIRKCGGYGIVDISKNTVTWLMNWDSCSLLARSVQFCFQADLTDLQTFKGWRT